MMKDKILIVEDDSSILTGLAYALEKEEYLVTQCRTIAEAMEKITQEDFALILLDLQLPDGRGSEISAEIKKRRVQVIYLTVVDDENEIVRCLEDGAADYILKPFRMRELLARIKRTLNTTAMVQKNIKIGNAVIDTDAGKVFVQDRLISLTALEYRLLLIFAENQSSLLTRELLLERIWDISGDFVEDNTLTVYVKRLRKKLGDAVPIITVRGIGYRVDQ
ncbi:response regulator transcription factor [Blautia sp.]|uniref:Stage 0 sporulation protein A homolog n=1 Tax=Blautia glucerasea TaxID=536633 RepID=A0A6N2RAC4_9FIRM